VRVVSWVGRHPLEWLLLALVGDVFMPAFHCNEIAISSQPHVESRPHSHRSPGRRPSSRVGGKTGRMMSERGAYQSEEVDSYGIETAGGAGDKPSLPVSLLAAIKSSFAIVCEES
jgi:hypothetical protein